MTARMILGVALVLTVIMSGCADPQVDSSETAGDTGTSPLDPRPAPPASPGPTPHTDPDTDTPSLPTHKNATASRHWNFSLDFVGDTVAVGFQSDEPIDVTIHEILHWADYGPTDVRQWLSALLLYEPTRGVSFLHSISYTTYNITDHHYHVETPLGTYDGEKYIEWGEGTGASGDNEMSVVLPPGDWTLIATTPGAHGYTYDLSLTFAEPMNVTGPVWGALGFNHDERTFQGTATIVASAAGAMLEQTCTITGEYDLIGRLLIAFFSGYHLGIEGPEGFNEYVATDTGTILQIPSLEKLPKYRMYGTGNWTFTVNGAGAGYALNLVGIDLPLPSKGYTGYFETTERETRCS